MFMETRRKVEFVIIQFVAFPLNLFQVIHSGFSKCVYAELYFIVFVSL